MPLPRKRSLAPLAVLVALAVPLTTAAAPACHPAALPLGAPGLPETRTVQQLAEGLTLTTITRGTVSAADHWTVDIAIPSGPVPDTMDPDTPATVLGSKDSAELIAGRLASLGHPATVVEESAPAYRDFAGGSQGFVVRVGSFPDQAHATTEANALKALGYKTSTVFTGGDQDQTAGPWVMRTLVIDPARYRGAVREDHGATLTGRRTTSGLAREVGALAAVNGGFFVINPADGVPGQSAGMVVEHGKVLRDSTNGRVVAILRDNGRRVEFAQLTTTVTLRHDGAAHRVAGLNRPPGLIRDCGGHPGDRPTSLPLMDVTCTNPDETVVLTPEFGAAPPAGPGLQAVVDAGGTVVSVGPRTGAAVPAGSTVVQAIGTEAAWLGTGLTVGQRVSVDTEVRNEHGARVVFGPRDSVVNGGPKLLTNGRPDIRPVADGLAHPGDPSYFYGWGVRRNPRTVIGTDRRGRVVLFEVDGRLPGYSQGLSVDEEARVLSSLGVVDAMNLDGGGSSAMFVQDGLVSKPSDATGERPIGDAVVVMPESGR